MKTLSKLLPLWDCNGRIFRIDLLNDITYGSESSTLYPANLTKQASTISNHPKTGKFLYTFESGIHERVKDDISSGDISSDIWSNSIISNQPNVKLYRFAISESNQNKIYTSYFSSSDPANFTQNWGHIIYESSDGGATFSNKTNALKNAVRDYYVSEYGSSYGSYWPLLVVTGIAVSTKNHNNVWVSLSGYDKHTKVYGSNNGGGTWFNADPNNCLGRLPVNDIVYQDGTDDRLYIATDAGVYTRGNNDDNWYRYGDIPNIKVQRLK